MNEGVIFTGALSKEELKESPGVPSRERVMRGPVAVIECIQEIPCDPCEATCPYGAISVTSPHMPSLDEEKCVGCGLCVPTCPGLAIFVVDMTHSESEALVSFPHEFLPLPEVGSKVDAVDREGRVVTSGEVVSVESGEEYDKTAVITISVPKELAEETRGISLKRRKT